MTIVAIQRIAAGGDGVGRLTDGRTVFVPRTAPGDEVEIEVTESKARFARGRSIRVITASPLRVEPGCAHYDGDRCGGCQLQHISAEGQLAAKRRIAGDALRRIGRRESEDPEGVPSPEAWRYRTSVTLAVRGLVIGLHRQGDPGAIFPLEDCRITSERLMGLWQRVKDHRQVLPADATSLVLRQDRDGGLHIVVVAGGERWDAAPFALAVGMEGVSVWWRPAEGAARVVAGTRTGFPATAFEQVNPALAGTIRSDAVAALGEISGQVVWDLYGGVGDTARALSKKGARVVSVDADPGAVEWARRAGGDVSYHAAKAEDAVRSLPPPDAVVVNPPRTGLHARVAAYLDRWRARAGGPARRVAYVSCDPATLARDLTRMPSLRLAAVRAYDLFPQTAHVETLAALEGGVKYDVTVGGRTFDILVDGETVTIAGKSVSGRLVAAPGGPLVRLSVEGVSRTYAMTRVAGGWTIQRDGRVWLVEVVDERSRSLRRLVGSRNPRRDDGMVRAPMPGLVVRLEVEPGQRVAAGAGLLVLEAMKMENEIRAVSGGIVKRVLVRPGQAVEKGADLVEVRQG